MKVIRASLAAALTLLSTTARPADPTLVAHWTFDEGAGMYAYDSSGNGNHGVVDRASWTDGLVGRALRFDGATSNVRVPSSAALNGSTGLTVEAWVKLASNGGARVIVSKWDDVARDWSYIFKKHNGADGLRIELSRDVHNDLADLGGAEALPLDRWLHVATTYDGTWVRLFVNGREDAATFAPGLVDASASDLLIGAVNPGAASEVFDGVIDEVSIFSRALPPAEVAARFAALGRSSPSRSSTTPSTAPRSTPRAGGRTSRPPACAGARRRPRRTTRTPGDWLDPSVDSCNGLSLPGPWGTVAVADGVASLAGGWSPAFPYVWTGASPFPAAGDFRVDVRMRWDEIAGHGTGVAVLRWPDTTPAGNNPPLSPGGAVLGVWADSATWAPRVGLLDGVVYGGATVWPPYDFHDYTLEYRGGAYSVRVDRGLYSPPAASDVRANAIWIGNPVITHWGISRWSAFGVDGVDVVSLPVLARVDVKPSEYPNLVKVGGTGSLPVAIFGSPALAVRDVVVSSIRLAGAPVAARSKGALMASYQDVNLDGLEDLVVQIDGAALHLAGTETAALLAAQLGDGRLVRGADSIVPQQ